MSDSEGIETNPPVAVAAVDPADEQSSALTDEQLTAAAPEVLAGSLSEYLAAWWRRIKNGESGALPVVVGLIVIIIFFQFEQSAFLTNVNLVNLLVQAAVFVMFGAAEIFALLLSEIDLSVGYTAAVGAFVIAELIAAPVGLPWWLAIIGGLAAVSMVGFLQGSLIARLGLPSFVVTLGGYLAMQGVMLELANVDKTAVGGVMPIDSGSPVYNLVNGNMSPTLGWVVLVVSVALFAVISLRSSARRRAQGLTAPPIGITILTITLTAIVGAAVVLICNSNRGAALSSLSGVPWVIPFVLVVLVIFTWLLTRTRLGRYIYAIGANPEAARRAGIKVNRVKIIGFMLCSMTAGIAGLIYESRLGNISVDFDGGQAVLYAVAAAVIGGTSLFGGRGRPFNALLGGIVIAVVFNGLGLMGVSAAVTDIATAVVLIAAVTLDALVRRRSSVNVR